MVTMPSGAIDTNADRLAGAAWARAGSGMMASSARPPPASTAVFRTVRRLMVSGNMIGILVQPGGHLDCGLNPVVTGAPTDVTGHCRVDLLQGRARGVGQQCGRGHDLSCLAVTTLHDIDFEPCILQSGTDRRLTNVLDGGDLGTVQAPHRGLAGTPGVPVHVNGTSSTQTRAAAELGSNQAELIPQHPQQWHLRRCRDLVHLAVDMKLIFHGRRPPGKWMVTVVPAIRTSTPEQLANPLANSQSKHR